MMMTMTGDMGIVKGVGLMKMAMGKNPTSVGLWTFMTMSEKLAGSMTRLAVVTFEAMDPCGWNLKLQFGNGSKLGEDFYARRTLGDARLVVPKRAPKKR